MANIVITGTGGDDVEFEGILLATFSTYRQGKQRWSEFSVYSWTGNGYVTEILGKSLMPGETTRRTVRTAATAYDCVRAFMKNGTLSDPAEEVLELAAEVDADIDLAMEEIFGD